MNKRAGEDFESPAFFVFHWQTKNPPEQIFCQDGLASISNPGIPLIHQPEVVHQEFDAAVEFPQWTNGTRWPERPDVAKLLALHRIQHPRHIILAVTAVIEIPKHLDEPLEALLLSFIIRFQ
jgi:hypothetical protein